MIGICSASVSYTHLNGELQRGFTSERLATYLRDKLVPKVDKDSKKHTFLKGKKK